MTTMVGTKAHQIFSMHWKPNKDLAIVALSWVLVVGALYTATNIVGQAVWGGMAYFLFYAIIGAALFGVGIPLYWMVVVRRRPVAELGLTTQRVGLSLGLQLGLAALLYVVTLARVQLPSLDQLIPLVALAVTIGFFEAVFWRGWVLLRLEEAFGIIPAIVLGSALYATYHIGYGMPAGEMVFLFFVGILFAVVFRVTKSVLILWPLFQPMGQLVTLVRDGLTLPLLAALGFVEVLVLMWVFVWLANRYDKKHRTQVPAA